MKSEVITRLKRFYGWANSKFEQFSQWGEKSKLHSLSVDKDIEHFSRLGWRVLIIAFGGFVIWASFVPLDRGVTASGFVITDGQRKVVQPISSGILEEVLVKEGEHVVAGQILVRMNSVHAESFLNITQENILGLEAQIESLSGGIDSKKKQVQILQQQLKNAKELAREGYLPRNRVLDLEQNNAQLNSAISMDESTLQERKRMLAEQQTKIGPQELELERAIIRSPVNGHVVNLQVFTPGGVVQAGQKLMEVTPDNQPLIVEAKLPLHLIDRVHEGESVDFMFTAFNRNRTPHIPGIVTMVGDDRIVDERPINPQLDSFYRIQAVVTPEGENMLSEYKLRAGMPVDVFIKTGERSFLSYMLKPIFDRAHTSLREE